MLLQLPRLVCARSLGLWVPVALLLASCTGGGSSDDDDATEDPTIRCHGDAGAEDVPIADSIDALDERWNANKELLRILYIGEPF